MNKPAFVLRLTMPLMDGGNAATDAATLTAPAAAETVPAAAADAVAPATAPESVGSIEGWKPPLGPAILSSFDQLEL